MDSLSLDAPSLTPQLRDGPQIGPEPTRELPPPADAGLALRDHLTASESEFPPSQTSTLIAASALSTARDAGMESPEDYALDVVSSLSSNGLDASQAVTAADMYLAGGGQLFEGMLSALRSPTLIAQSPSVNGLSPTQRADFSLISESRQSQLDRVAETYIASYADGRVQRVNGDFIDPGLGGAGGVNVPIRETYTVPRIDFADLAGVLEDLMERTDMGDIDKAYVWNEIAGAKGNAQIFEYENAEVHIDNRGVRDYLLDDHPTREWNTSNHTVVPFTDGYHGFGSPNAAEPGMGYASRADAYNRIQEHEEGIILGIGANPGDRHASMAAVNAFHAWRDAPEGGRFNAFAQTWIDGVVDPNYR